MGTSKKRFIELHGEEAGEKEKDRRRLRGKKWSDENREKLNANAAIYRESNKELLKERQQVFYDNHPGKKTEYQKKNYSSNKDKIKKYQKEYSSTKERRASRLCYDYKKEDNLKDLQGFNITQKWILENIFSSSCVYCGDSDWRHLGCDRIDNSLPHTPDNCVCSCWNCNNDRQKKNVSVSDYIKYKKVG